MECVLCGKQFRSESRFLKHYYEEKAIITNLIQENPIDVIALWMEQYEARFDRIYRQPDIQRRQEIETIHKEIEIIHEDFQKQIENYAKYESIPFPQKHYTDLDETKLKLGSRSFITISEVGGEERKD